MRSTDIAPIRENIWKNTGRLVNNFFLNILPTAIIRPLSVSLIRRVDLVSRKLGLSFKLCIELHNRLADLILFLHAQRDSLASMQDCGVIPAPEDFSNLLQ